MTLNIDSNLSLEYVKPAHAKELYTLALTNFHHISEWMPWIGNMTSQTFIDNFIKGAMERKKQGSEHAFVILLDKKIIGRIGVYKIDQFNRIGEIGYWIAKDYERCGYVVKSVNKLMEYCFKQLDLNRLEIRCGEFNTRSQHIPEKLNFNKEALLKEAEWLNNNFQNLYLYAKCRSEFERGMWCGKILL